MFGNGEKKGSFFERLKEGLSKTKQSLVRNVDEMLFGEKQIDRDLFEELEEMLITADVGPAFASELIDEMKVIAKRSDLSSPDVLRKIMRDNIHFILKQREAPLEIPKNGLYTVMVVGVNGTGKTTTIGKIANEFKGRGSSVMLAAADTFRAAAIEQLEVWGERVGIPVIKQKMGADPSAVVFDAVQAAKARGIDVLIIDTAGRLHTKVNLMEELKKVKRIMGREFPGLPTRSSSFSTPRRARTPSTRRRCSTRPSVSRASSSRSSTGRRRAASSSASPGSSTFPSATSASARRWTISGSLTAPSSSTR